VRSVFGLGWEGFWVWAREQRHGTTASKWHGAGKIDTTREETARNDAKRHGTARDTGRNGTARHDTTNDTGRPSHDRTHVSATSAPGHDLTHDVPTTARHTTCLYVCMCAYVNVCMCVCLYVQSKQNKQSNRRK